MTKSLLLIALLLSPWAFAKKNDNKINLKTRGLLKRISCTYHGYSPTGPSVGSIEFVDPQNTVCTPLGSEQSSSPTNGLLGQLILRTPEMGSNVKSVLEYHEKGLRMEQNLYFADVNIPTRPFTDGFTTQSGDVLVDTDGQRLIEHFAVEYSSILKLAAEDREGHYELSLLSDDGARLFVKEGDSWNELINNDGVHATRLGCPYRTVELKRDSELPIKILYFQGPRYHISNVLLWKHHKKARTWKRPASHSLCGVQGNNVFFNPNNGKKQLPMKLLEATGWSVVATGNFKMPESKPNPSVEEKLALSDFKIDSISGDNAEISWSTNLPSSSQLRVVNVFTGEQMFTNLDPELVTVHKATLTGLIRGLQYRIQAISVDAKGNEVRSEEILLLP